MTDRNAFAVTCQNGVCQFTRPETKWLSSGWNGGQQTADCAYNISVPEGWTETDLDGYTTARFEQADYVESGPILLTGVDLEHARIARSGSVTVVATAGVSNPAALPMEPSGDGSDPAVTATPSPEPGTVNLLVGTTRALAPGAAANLLAIAVEAKAATLLATVGVPGTTSDAVIVGHDPTGTQAQFSGSATAVGAATRACVRDAVRASLRSRYGPHLDDAPATVEDATYGVSTSQTATVSCPPTDGSADGTTRT